MAKAERMGLFGGSFDPVHVGHIILGQDALEQLGLTRLFLIPCRRSPLKDRGPEAPDALRLEMLQTAVSHEPRIEVSALEIERQGHSYTIETVEHFRQCYPDSEWYWLMGADQLADLGRWHRIGDLSRLVTFAVAHRGEGQGCPSEHPETRAHLVWLQPRRLDFSSTEIRQRLREGRSSQPFVPAPVAQIISQTRLYQKPSSIPAHG